MKTRAFSRFWPSLPRHGQPLLLRAAPLRGSVLSIVTSLTLACALPPALNAQPFRASRTVWASDPAEVPALANEIDLLLDAGHLKLERVQTDGTFPGRYHERMNQYHHGLRVFGGQLVWQKQAGLVLSITGNVYDTIAVNVTPTLTASEAAARALAPEVSGTRIAGDIELVVLPLAERYVLAYHLRLRGAKTLQVSFIDAHSGERLLTWNNLRSQNEGIGLGIGSWGDEKKMTSQSAAGTYRAIDTVRPFGIKTYDVNFDVKSWAFYEAVTDAFLATDGDNEWRDGAVVDAHVYAGYTYDYYFKRHNRRGIDDQGLVTINFVHFFPQSAGFNNAFYDPEDNSMNYGDGDGEEFTFFSASLDIVAHEITHAVTYFSSNLIYFNEPGALNESISDIMGVSTEFLFEPVGNGRQQAEWLQGEDLFINFGQYFRSFSNPSSVGDPDHYSVRCLPPVCTENFDNGGVHINSSIANHAFYLMVVGGTNRVSGLRVEGVGFEQMSRIESIFYRAFMFYLVPSSNFADAREATIRAARELYGAGSVEEQTVRDGWQAVGVE